MVEGVLRISEIQFIVLNEDTEPRRCIGELSEEFDITSVPMADLGRQVDELLAKATQLEFLLPGPRYRFVRLAWLLGPDFCGVMPAMNRLASEMEVSEEVRIEGMETLAGAIILALTED